MSYQEDVTILGEIVVFAGEVWGKPVGLDSLERREHLKFLQEKYDEIVGASAYRFIMGRRVPMLLTAIKGTLDARRHGDDRLAADFEQIVGVLVPGVRQDAQALLARAREA